MSYLETKRNAIMNASSGLQPLPSEYQEVEWVGNTDGTEYIETNYYPCEKTFTDIDIAITESNTSDCNPWGISASEGRLTQFTNFTSGKGFAFHINYALNRYRDTGWIIKDIVLNQFYNIQIQLGNLGVIVDDVDYDYSEYDFSQTMYIFKARGRANNGGKVRFRKFDLYENGTIVRKFVPCYRISDDEIGMYDLVTRTFFTNQGGGALTKGSDV